jgi:hypothetical protein
MPMFGIEIAPLALALGALVGLAIVGAVLGRFR